MCIMILRITFIFPEHVVDNAAIYTIMIFYQTWLPSLVAYTQNFTTITISSWLILYVDCCTIVIITSFIEHRMTFSVEKHVLQVGTL